MKFGILYNIDYQPSVHGSPSSYYEEILEQVELLEALGYDAAWFGEHHYSGYSFGNPAMIALAAAAHQANPAWHGGIAHSAPSSATLGRGVRDA